MPRSLFDPASPDASIKRMCRPRGAALPILVAYFRAPENVQSIGPRVNRKWFFANLRSDLAAWRSGLEQIPMGRLFEIPWLAACYPNGTELRARNDIATFGTTLFEGALLVGRYSALLNATPLAGTRAQIFLEDCAESNDAAQDEHRIDLEARLKRLRREEATLATRARIPAMSNPKLLAELEDLRFQIALTEKELQA